MNNWLQKVSQTYPHINWDFGKLQAKLENWGYRPIKEEPYYILKDFVFNPKLMFIPAQNVKLVVEHLAEKHFPILRNKIIESVKDFCDMETYWDIQEAGDSKELIQLNIETDRAANNFTLNAEIIDSDFSSSFRLFIFNEVVGKINDLVQLNVKDETFYVRVYGFNKAYGGAEEGGWWYNSYTVIDTEQVSGLQAACHRKSQLEKQYSNYAHDTFYEDLSSGTGGVVDVYDEQSSQSGGMGDLNYNGDTEGMDFPKGWTPSSFEKYRVTVELNDNPILEDNGNAHYE
ncbi:MAG: hypothetical protein FK734_13340 [Asgard group archaeon]|nr:hypothetical protein [Asgard group archaeon]